MVKGLLPPSLGSLAWGTVSSVLLLLLIRYFLARDSRTWGAVGLGMEAASWLRFGAGLLIGLVTYVLTLFLISSVAGPIRIGPGAGGALTALPLVAAGVLALGVMEELAFRSYPFWTATEAIGPWGGQVLVAVAFALMHIAYGWPWQTVLLGVLPSGWLFGAAALASRGLALPLGIHVGMNLCRWMSGETDQQGLVSLDLRAADPARIATWAPMIGALTPLAVSLALWQWGRRRPLAPGSTGSQT